MLKKILILSANPKNTSQLRLDKEVREIDAGLHRSKYREKFEIHQKWAVRFWDLRRALLDYKPQIVHFSGHGEKDGLMVEGELELPVSISSKALSGLFELCSDHVECVILNACYSAAQADAINKHINYVIGMPGEIQDKAAIEFVVGFYDALGAGNTVEKAFKFGCNAIEQICPDLPRNLIPRLIKGKRADTEPLVEVVKGDSQKIDVQSVKGEKINVLSLNPFWVLSFATLAPPALCRFLKWDCINLHILIKKALFLFWGISFLIFLFLGFNSYSQLKKMAEKIKREGMLVTIKVSLFQFTRGMMKRPLRFISQLFLFLSFYPVIMESDYYFQKNLLHYYLYKGLVVFIAFSGITFIYVKPERLFKKKLAEGLKILSFAVLSFLILFSSIIENDGRRYLKCVDYYFFSGLVDNSPILLSFHFLKKFLGKLLEYISKFKHESKPSKPNPDDPFEPDNPPPADTHKRRIVVRRSKNAAGKTYFEACALAKSKAVREFQKDYTNRELKENEYRVIEYKWSGRLANGQVLVEIIIEFYINKEKK